ncbi:branched-chain amino acid ABC transporter permease, partial [Micromonospora sp. NPDC051296]
MTEVKSPEVPAPPAGTPSEPTAEPTPWTRIRPFLPLVVLAVALILPYSTLHLPGILEGALNSPGTLQLLAVCLVFGGLAAGYDLLFGRTGMLSFGHALYFAAGVYGTDILITRAGLPLWQAAPLAIIGGTILAGLIGAVALRTVGIAFAMV